MKEKKNYVKKNCPKENQSSTVGEKEKEETKKKARQCWRERKVNKRKRITILFFLRP